MARGRCPRGVRQICPYGLIARWHCAFDCSRLFCQCARRCLSQCVFVRCRPVFDIFSACAWRARRFSARLCGSVRNACVCVRFRCRLTPPVLVRVGGVAVSVDLSTFAIGINSTFIKEKKNALRLLFSRLTNSRTSRLRHSSMYSRVTQPKRKKVPSVLLRLQMRHWQRIQ